MPDYKTGSYLLTARKEWCCLGCKKSIEPQIKHFARIKEYGPDIKRWDGELYKEKEYKRWHLDCALELTDLTEYERSKIAQPATSK